MFWARSLSRRWLALAALAVVATSSLAAAPGWKRGREAMSIKYGNDRP